MASIESKIYTLLSGSATVIGLVSSRIYPQHRPQNTTNPAAVYFRVAGHREITMNQGYVNLENVRISIECYATAIDARRELADTITTVMEAATTFKAISAMSPVDFYDPVINEYKRIVDFSIWNHT
jgi:hypothetical protein